MMRQSRRAATLAIFASAALAAIAQENFSTRPRVVLSPEEFARLIHEEQGLIIRDRANDAFVQAGAPMRLVTVVAPIYPPELFRERIAGEVEALFLVNEAGDVEEARIERATNEYFQQSVLAALKQWKFAHVVAGTALKRFAARQTFQFKP